MNQKLMLGLGLGVAVVLIVVALSMSISPYITVTQLLNKSTAYGVQVVGTIVKNSTKITPNGVYFKLTDGKSVVNVYCKHLPADYREGVQVVVVGDYYDHVLHATQVLFKCASKYTVRS